jgi:HPr kinase/phosphorylase
MTGVDSGALNMHATCVAIGSKGVLIEGPSGSGKSLLAWMLADGVTQPGGAARFVADDRTVIAVSRGRLMARAPVALKNLAELPGVGLLPVETSDVAEIVLVARLCPFDTIERMPVAETVTLSGIPLPLLKVPRREAFVSAIMIRRHPALLAIDVLSAVS